MDKARLLDVIGGPDGGMFWVRDMRLDGWGSAVTLECGYVLSADEMIRFDLLLTDCREIQWRIYAHLQPPATASRILTSLVNIRLGTDNHRKPLQILADAFGLTISYGKLEIVRPQS